jgi:hypothetical protein
MKASPELSEINEDDFLQMIALIDLKIGSKNNLPKRSFSVKIG